MFLPFTFSTDKMSYSSSLKMIYCFVVIFRFGIFLNRKSSVASLKAAKFAQRSLPWRPSTNTRMLAKTATRCEVKPSESVIKVFSHIFAGLFINPKLILTPSNSYPFLTVDLPSSKPVLMRLVYLQRNHQYSHHEIHRNVKQA